MNWSAQARKILEFTLADAARRAHFDGADGVEVADELRARVEQELAARGIANVTSEDVTAVFAVIGVPVATDVPPLVEAPAKKKSGCI